MSPEAASRVALLLIAGLWLDWFICSVFGQDDWRSRHPVCTAVGLCSLMAAAIII